MKEIFGDLFEQNDFSVDAICITTNGDVNSKNQAIMGRGCAKEAKDKCPNIENVLGTLLNHYSNVVHILGKYRKDLPLVLSFPVKHRWSEKADLKLIKKSALELKLIADDHSWQKIIIPRPGCGAGGLDWCSQVKPVIKKILDDRFYIITNEKT